MSTNLSTRPSRQGHPPRHRHLAERPNQPVRRVSLVDQIALRLGLLLVTWGRRANHYSRAQLSTRYEQRAAREQRELHAERMLRLSSPRL
jgi:hypothetical protein